MEIHNLIKELKEAYPFVYELQGTYYLIGATTFELCDEFEIEQYKIFEKQYTILGLKDLEVKGEKRYDFEFSKLKELASAMKNIIDRGCIISNDNERKMGEQLKLLLSNMSEEEILNFEKQIKRFKYSLFYMNEYDILSELKGKK